MTKTEARRKIKRSKWQIMQAIGELRVQSTFSSPKEIGVHIFDDEVVILTEVIGEAVPAVGVVYPDCNQYEVYSWLRDQVVECCA